MKKVYFKTFGCRTNIYDTALMQKQLSDFTQATHENEADIIVVASCTVTNQADTRARSYINKHNKTKKVILSGCGAISRGEELYDKGLVEGVIGHSYKEDINSLLKREKKFLKLGDLNFIDKTIVDKFETARAFIKIQEGCNFNCSYCIIPSVRGKARSQDENFILAQIANLAELGYEEFILTGTNIGSYGKDTASSLAKLLKKISYTKGLKRIRLGSIEPSQIDTEFKELLGEPWLEKHLHIALQHSNEEMLKIMRRRNHLKNDLELFYEIADKGFALGTDYIVGHPGESEELFNDGYKNLIDFPLTHIHAFTYSKRSGTHAATLKNQVSNKIAKQRLAQITDLVNEKNHEFRKQNNQNLDIFIEEKKNEKFHGYDQYFNKIILTSKDDLLHKWVSLDSSEVKPECNYGTI
ncbi:MAG: tRNA-t(6)A37 methylthiotransferase [uncultured Campylobacterales bacterium]|uniref:tRNA-t(6)A37 methylthiotransferase n=1 Tax=uncultured Campylobacterales bacterium TaxID=352960 RepID=A0A6S6T871_9BACT|nr:MAG: tRNA-t(6)A37 methylthiotransferase [uncultured Campylobacterales bacterium]